MYLETAEDRPRIEEVPIVIVVLAVDPFSLLGTELRQGGSPSSSA